MVGCVCKVKVVGNTIALTFVIIKVLNLREIKVMSNNIALTFENHRFFQKDDASGI
jgi:hypothetical protein